MTSDIIRSKYKECFSVFKTWDTVKIEKCMHIKTFFKRYSSTKL